MNKYTKQEELANWISHLAGALLAIAALVLMVSYSIRYGNTLHVVTTSIFGTSLIVLYSTSFIAHALSPGRRKDMFFNLDRVAIYILIAGSYTPISLVALNGTVGWILFGSEWGLALLGCLLIAVRPGEFNTGVNSFHVAAYALMGWMILLAIVPVFRHIPPMGIAWIFIGGMCYTLGILFYKVFRFPFHHLVWHLLVLAGSISHFFAVFLYIIPR